MLQIIIQYFVKIIFDRNILKKFDGIIIFNRNIPKKYLNKKSKKIIENFGIFFKYFLNKFYRKFSKKNYFYLIL